MTSGGTPTTKRSFRVYTILGVLLLLAVQSGCTTNAATGRSQLNLMSRQEEISMGEQAMPDVTKEYGGKVTDPTLQAYVDRVGRDLAAKTEGNNPSLPWEFTILNSDVINAFSLPGGKVFITLGIMHDMKDEAELAGVLGHEIGHVTAQHVDERLTQSIGLQLGVEAATIGTRNSKNDLARYVPLIVGVGGQGYLLKYSRDQESEADSLGMRYMARCGYDPKGQLEVMQMLDETTREQGGAGAPEWLSTHPYPDTRIKRITKLLKTTYRNTQNNPEYSLYADRFQQQARPTIDALFAKIPKHPQGGQ